MNVETFQDLRQNLPFSALHKYSPTPRFLWLRKAKKIPLLLTGGIGDVIIAIDLVRYIRKHCGEVEVYSQHPKVATFFLGEPTYEAKKIPGYDFWIQINSMVRFHFSKNFTGFKSSHLTDLYLHFKQAQSGEFRNLINLHPYLDNLMSLKAVEAGLTRFTLPWHLIGVEPPPPTYFAPYSLPDSVKGILFSPPYHQPYITLHHGFETNQGHITGRSTKNIATANLFNFVTLFKKKYPHHKVVQLGGPTGENISNVDINFKNKLSIEDSLRVLSRSQCHVDGDSGLVHAARRFDVRSVVTFGPTPSQFFGYKENINLTSTGCHEGGACWWLKDNWLQKCVLGYDIPLCLDAIPSDKIFNSVETILEHRNLKYQPID